MVPLRALNGGASEGAHGSVKDEAGQGHQGKPSGGKVTTSVLRPSRNEVGKLLFLC